MKVFFFLNEFLKFVVSATFPPYLIMFHGLFKIYRDCEAHTECVTVLLAHQNAHIFDWKLQITSFNGTEGRYVFFPTKTRVSFICGIFDCECTIHFSILSFCYLNEWTMWTHTKEVDAYLYVSSLTIFCMWADFFEVNRKFNVVGD